MSEKRKTTAAALVRRGTVDMGTNPSELSKIKKATLSKGLTIVDEKAGPLLNMDSSSQSLIQESEEEKSELEEGFKIDPETGEKVEMTEIEKKIEKLKKQLEELLEKSSLLESQGKMFPIDYEPPMSEFEVSSHDSLVPDQTGVLQTEEDEREEQKIEVDDQQVADATVHQMSKGPRDTIKLSEISIDNIVGKKDEYKKFSKLVSQDSIESIQNEEIMSSPEPL